MGKEGTYWVYMAQGSSHRVSLGLGRLMWHLWGRGCLYQGFLGGWGSLWSPYAQALPNPGLRKLLRLVQHRDTFVEAQIQRHQVGRPGELEGSQESGVF